MIEDNSNNGGSFVKKTYHFYKKNTSVPNKFIFDTSLPDSSKLLLIALEALPEVWEIYQKNLAEMLGFGRDKMQNAMRCLLEQGYMRRIQKKSEKNRFTHYQYEFYWEPIFKDGNNVEPDKPPEFPDKHAYPDDAFPGTGTATGKVGTGEQDTTWSSRINLVLKDQPTPNPEKGLVGGLQKAEEKQKIHQCLESIEIKQKDKIRLSKQYSEEIVSKSVAHCTKPGFCVQTSLDRSIFYFCKNPEQIVQSKKEIELAKANEEFQRLDRITRRVSTCNQIERAVFSTARQLGLMIRVVQDYIEISGDRIQQKLYFVEEKFEDLLVHTFRKAGLDISGFFKSMPT